MLKKIRFGLAALLLLGGFGLSSPALAVNSSVGDDYGNYSVEQLEQLIAKLQARLVEMRQGAKCFVTDRDLSLGDGEGDDLSGDVKRLQEFLREKGHFNYKSSTGYFGKVTRTALQAFQRQSDLAATGEFDAATRAKAHALYCKTLRKATKAAEKAEVKLEQKTEKTTAATAPLQSLVLSGSNANVSWTAVGQSSMGFKVVWSKTTAPTYPLRDVDKYLYFSHPAASSAKLYAFAGPGTYYVRVCQYLGGKCGTYSNEIAVSLTE